MKKRKPRKATMKEVENVMSNLIVENQRNQVAILTIQKVLNDYIEFKKDNKKFTKYIEDTNGRKDKRNSEKSPDKK